MSGNQTWNNIGEEIKDAVEDALQSGDFNNLNQMISDTVSGAVGSVREQLGRTAADWNAAASDWKAKAENSASRRNMTQEWMEAKKARDEEARHARERGGRQSAQARQEGKAKESQPPAESGNGFSGGIQANVAPFRKVGTLSSVLYRVFGGIGTGVTGILVLVFSGLALTFGHNFWVGLGIVTVLLVIFILMIQLGCRQAAALRRALEYWELCGYRHYVNLEDLALHMNKSVKFICRDVKRMLAAGFFPQGHLDRQESCLMLDDKIYAEYLSLEKQRKILEKEEKKAARKAGKKRKQAALESQSQPQTQEEPAQAAPTNELEAIIGEGRDYIRRLRELNDNIPGEVISQKLFRLENLLKEIFDSLKEHPEQMPQMHKFMNYYLPTTLKLVAAYEEFDSLSVQGEDIQEAKRQIEKTLDTINSAFGELLNKLFRDTAFDVTTDAQVLQTMLAKEGLTGGTGEMRKEKEMEFVSARADQDK